MNGRKCYIKGLRCKFIKTGECNNLTDEISLPLCLRLLKKKCTRGFLFSSLSS